MESKISATPKAIFDEYLKGVEYKKSLNDNGIYEQTKMNERFFAGDQWHGANCGNNRPLVRRNIIKRIGEYKMSTITASPIAVNYSADGIPDTVDMQDKEKEVKQQFISGETPKGTPDDAEISVIMSAMSDYFRTTAERVKLDNKKEQALRNAYISGTCIAYTYWDDKIETGLYADEEKSQQIKGDICLEILDIENVNFGDANSDDVQSQPFIIIAQRKDVEAVKREAKANGENPENIKTDEANSYSVNSGDRGEQEANENRRVTVLTKLYKEYDDNGDYKVMALKCTQDAFVREPWDLGLKNYPIAKMCWERRRTCAYGDSEITYMIPNQIAINRALTAEIWALMANGMPIMVVNGDVVESNITNNPAQVIKVFGGTDYMLNNAISYVNPPQFSAQYQNAINDLASNTLSDSGANDAALGNLRPDNASAIIQMREAATAPMQTYMNRFYDFIEDIARIWADFWINKYGDRSLKIKDKSGTWYLPFKAARYEKLLITAKVDVGASTMWSEAVVISSLDNLLENGLITFEQYLERLPKGMIPDVTGLQEDLKQQAAAPADEASLADGEISDDEVINSLKQKNPELYEKYMRMSPEQQKKILEQIKSSGQEAQQPEQLGQPQNVKGVEGI